MNSQNSSAKVVHMRRSGTGNWLVHGLVQFVISIRNKIWCWGCSHETKWHFTWDEVALEIELFMVSSNLSFQTERKFGLLIPKKKKNWFVDFSFIEVLLFSFKL